MDLQRCRPGLGATFPDLTHAADAADAVFFVQPGEDWLFIHQRLSFHNENNQLPSNYPMMRAESEKHFVPRREMFRTNIGANIGISEEFLLKILYFFASYIWNLLLKAQVCWMWMFTGLCVSISEYSWVPTICYTTCKCSQGCSVAMSDNLIYSVSQIISYSVSLKF